MAERRYRACRKVIARRPKTPRQQLSSILRHLTQKDHRRESSHLKGQTPERLTRAKEDIQAQLDLNSNYLVENRVHKAF